ncbi:MAG: hypothetical protein ACK5WH_13705 [Hyphomonadaceae bacterium]
MTPFACLLAASGLSYAEAGLVLGATKETVRDWARGKSRTPADALAWAHRLVDAMIDKADTLVDAYEDLAAQHGAPSVIEIAVSTDDHEAQSNGFLNLAHERAIIGLAVAQLPIGSVKIAPRGSTIVLAAAEKND